MTYKRALYHPKRVHLHTAMQAEHRLRSMLPLFRSPRTEKVKCVWVFCLCVRDIKQGGGEAGGEGEMYRAASMCDCWLLLTLLPPLCRFVCHTNRLCGLC